jgi:hypothetical protein
MGFVKGSQFHHGGTYGKTTRKCIEDHHPPQGIHTPRRRTDCLFFSTLLFNDHLFGLNRINKRRRTDDIVQL